MGGGGRGWGNQALLCSHSSPCGKLLGRGFSWHQAGLPQGRDDAGKGKLVLFPSSMHLFWDFFCLNGVLESLHWTPGFQRGIPAHVWLSESIFLWGLGLPIHHLSYITFLIAPPVPSSENMIIVCSRISLLTIHHFISMCNILGGFSNQFYFKN